MPKTIYFLFFLFNVLFCLSQTTIVYTTASTFIVPATVTSISIKVYGGAGGTGGQDCGAGCTNAAAGPTGFVIASFAVVPGNTVSVYPGGKGVDGANGVTGSGGGAGGTDTYPLTNYNGGNGGNSGGSGSSGGGGGGGAASIVSINASIKIVAGGAGGGGGMANQSGSGQAGSATTSSNGLNNGGNGTSTSAIADGGGGGGGGGGQFASAGGGLHAAGTETAGNGGFLGGNSVTGATLVTTNGSIAWTSAGQIEITYLSTLPVTWLSFNASKQNNDVLLNWSTASEQNTKDYRVQQSTNGSAWNDIGVVQAAGNSNVLQQYTFVDHNPVNGINFYRLLQEDVNNNFNYSKIISIATAALTLRIYPNPVSNGMLTVNLNKAAEIIIYNSTGIRVMQKQLQAGNHILNLSQLAKGIYSIKTGTDELLFVLK